MLTQFKKICHAGVDALLALSLPAKCALLLLVVLALHSALLLVASARGHHQIVTQQQDEFARQWVKQIAFQAQQGLIRNDRVSLLGILRLHLDNPLLGYASIKDSEGKVLVEVGSHNDRLSAYSAPILLGRDIAGSVSIALDPSEPQSALLSLNTQLIILAAVLASLAAGLALAASQRLDKLLQTVTRNQLQPSEVPLKVGYAGRDSFGVLLDTLQQIEPTLPKTEVREADWVVLHLHWANYTRLSQQWGKAELNRRLTRSYQQAHALARLYHGALKIHRRDGVTLRFNTIPGADDPLQRALCCAHLLQSLDLSLGARAAIGSVRTQGNQFQLEAMESGLVDALAGTEGAGIQTRLPGDLNARLTEWAEASEQGLIVKERYRQLLDKQLTRLEQQVQESFQD